MDRKHLFQKIFAIFLLLFIPAFIIANYSMLRSKRDLSCDMYNSFISQGSYLTEKMFVVVLYSPSNFKSCEQSLTSILRQQYDSYRVVLLHEEMKEEEIEKIKHLAAKENKSHLLTIISPKERLLNVDAFREVIEECKDDEIIVQLESSDWLAHERVLEKLNQVYSSNSEIWLTYSQYMEYPSYKKGRTQPYVKRLLRDRYSKKTPWINSHFKTYYARVFKQLKQQTPPLYGRSLIRDSLDPYMLPMVDLSKNHIRFIEDVLFVQNSPPSLSLNNP
jgi:hypothetical protein